MQNFKNLDVWQKAHSLTIAVYRITEAFPKDELYGLTSQIRRAAVSVPSNISEGCSRDSSADFGRFLQIALGSANELDYQLLLSRDLQFIGNETYDSLSDQIDHVRRMIISLLRKTSNVSR